ncbi:hypothetical protein D0Z08_04695 [Nocardioides immobilis]|uniref:SAF domain-containing protein n=1 Tax=Nocardioides immobilis TaxID=2049295 RepID=A0A417Y6Z7_9ACTN|nr:SAF domain-containing protein [Nocardioides immobilis]RHW28281.1 hypothetical protein D0Z08_04695 [Nocardioides immobilis]
MTLSTNTERMADGSSRDQGLGLRSTLGQVTKKRPRRLGQWVATMLFVLVVVLGLVTLFQSQSDRVEVLVVTNPVAAGQVIDKDDVRPAQVAGVDGAVHASDIESIVGKRAAAGLVDGQVLTDAALSEEEVPADGERLVAIRLDKGRVPGGLIAGDLVDVLAAPPEGDPGTKAELEAPKVLATGARVDSVGKTPEGAVVVTVLVEDGLADVIAAHSAAGQVTIVQAPLSGEE